MQTRRLIALAAAPLLAAAVIAGPAPAFAGGPKHCPPGLAKKGSCIPPGQRKKWYRGDRLPGDVHYRIIQYGDYGLRPPGSGQIYIETGGDIYLLAEATRRIIEAINLIGATSN